MKTLFVCAPHSFVDVITNSSSELFVGFNNSKKALEELIESVYPDYLNEYDPLCGIEELDLDTLATYINYKYESWSNLEQKFIRTVVPGFTYDEMWETVETDYVYPDGEKYSFIRVKDSFYDDLKRIYDGIDPDRKMFFLFSKGENPNFEMQEKLSVIMNRFHLG